MTNPTLPDLGWRAFFADQLAPGETLSDILRIASVQRTAATGIGPNGEVPLSFAPGMSAGTLAIGDWVLHSAESHRIRRILDRESSLSRRAAGAEAKSQLIAANVDCLFITSSCNADFNPARLERYVALALDAGITPVIVLTKADEADDPADYHARAIAISDRLGAVITLDAREEGEIQLLREWCGRGQTVAFIGSSGVGKSTLINGLTGSDQSTAGMRMDDAKGRHTTTARSLHLLAEGGVVIDMPGMRELAMLDVARGIDILFDDISALAADCKFNDCSHMVEPGCAIRAAVAEGVIDPARVTRWKKLKEENNHNTALLGGPAPRARHGRKRR